MRKCPSDIAYLKTVLIRICKWSKRLDPDLRHRNGVHGKYPKLFLISIWRKVFSSKDEICSKDEKHNLCFPPNLKRFYNKQMFGNVFV